MSEHAEIRHRYLRTTSALLALSWVAVTLNAARVLPHVEVDGGLAWLWLGAALMSQAGIFLLPAMVLGSLGGFLLDRGGRCRAPGAVLVGLAAVHVVAVQVVIFTDVIIYRFVGFHINGFLWNVLLTPGGLASLGNGSQNEATILAIAAGAFLAQVGLFIVGWRLALRSPRLAAVTRWRVVAALAALVALGAGERLAFGLADLKGYRPVVTLSTALPMYVPTTMRNLGRYFGMDVRSGGPSMRANDRLGLTYPKKPLVVSKDAPNWNVVWLVAESLRWDMLEPEVMPRTHAFARRARWFKNHQSGGNGTRMGMFSMFYGIYGSYWFRVKAERRSPVILDELQSRGYRLEVRTSASFTYPEFDQTIFANVPTSSLFTLKVPDPSDRDAAHVDKLLEFVDGGGDKPFFAFMFFESTHAHYAFPASAVIRPDYIRAFNYATVDLVKDMPGLKARYVNSAHALDAHLARVVEHLEKKKLLDRTILVITGDHGEEFMEHGRWGHNSDFSREQISVPLILCIPGAAPGEDTSLTSHHDIAPTLLKALGVESPPGDHSLGVDLLSNERRGYNVITDWDAVVYSDEHDRAIFKLSGAGRPAVRHDDVPVEDPMPFLTAKSRQLQEMVSGLRAFSSRAQK